MAKVSKCWLVEWAYSSEAKRRGYSTESWEEGGGREGGRGERRQWGRGEGREAVEGSGQWGRGEGQWRDM